MHLVFCGTGWLPVVDAIRSRLPEGTSIGTRDPRVPVASAVADAEVILPSNASVGRREISSAPRLRLIQQPAAGYDGVDLAAAREAGIPVCHAPAVNSDALCETALLLMLAVIRRLPVAARHLSEGTLGVPIGQELMGKSLGLIGYGRSAQRLSQVATALGMEVRFVRSTHSRADLLEMLRVSDIVSVHCPLTPRTRGLLDAEAFECLRPGAVLVNAARGPIVDRTALTAALDEQRLTGVGLDVGWREPWDVSDPFLSREDVVVLPHIGGSTEEAFGRIGEIVAENVRRLESGRPLLYRISE